MSAQSPDDEASRSPSADDSGNEANGDAGGAAIKTEDQAGVNEAKAKSSHAKDPTRPRRKKARRACFACQRAHLTCGDERPCQRCVKRGIMHQCHDGVRKKAKYLQDGPIDTQYGGIPTNNYQYATPQQRDTLAHPAFSSPTSTQPYTSQIQATSYPLYNTAVVQSQLPQSMRSASDPSRSFSNQRSPLPASFDPLSAAQGNASLQSLANAMQQSAPSVTPNVLPNAYGSSLLDPYDHSQYDFDPASFNFGNHYGALEFGMLGHMSSGAADSPSNLLDQQYSTSQPGTMAVNYNQQSPVNLPQPYTFDQNPAPNNWQDRHGDSPTNLQRPNTQSAFTIGTNSALTSPNSTSSPQTTTLFEDRPSATNAFGSNPISSVRSDIRAAKPRRKASQAPVVSKYTPRRDSSSIYESVTQPYDYTGAFHALTAFVQRRFSPAKTLSIAKSLASIRPSFIATTRTLNRADLVFMEQCFQRTLWEYENFINRSGTPTLVCRRTGEVAAVGREFTYLTGWRKGILLGKGPNLNANTGRGGKEEGSTGTSSRGTMNTPRLEGKMGMGPGEGRREQPVFIGELLDDESVIEFYDDFSRLAFEDPRGSVTRRCGLLKYLTKDELARGRGRGGGGRGGGAALEKAGSKGIGGEEEEEDDVVVETGGAKAKSKMNAADGADVGEAEIDDLAKDGKVECTYCWTVKRDVFDIPMLLVMNFLPHV